MPYGCPLMRLGFLGPAQGRSEDLGRAADFILNVANVDRAVYLGDDDSLNATVASWAGLSSVGVPPPK